MYRYVWKIKLNNPADTQKFIDHWRQGSTILQEYPGAKGTHLHEVRNEPDSFFAVAEWESKAARDAMQADAEANTSERAQRWNQLSKNDSFGEIISFFGEELEVVLPKS